MLIPSKEKVVDDLIEVLNDPMASDKEKIKAADKLLETDFKDNVAQKIKAFNAVQMNSPKDSQRNTASSILFNLV